MTHDGFFEIYSSAEERSAVYMACGMAEESGEPVVIICTGATASRNYMPALTEAYYRKIPILAVTCSRRSFRIGHNMDQVTDRTLLPRDVAKLSVQMPLEYDMESEWNSVVVANKAILELTHRGMGPVHIKLETNYSTDYSTKELPTIRKITRVEMGQDFVALPKKKIAIFVGSHMPWTKELTDAVDRFCQVHDSVVFGDHTANYKGKYWVRGNISGQQAYTQTLINEEVDILIHIGDVHAPAQKLNAKEVWRVNPDGELRDTFGRLKYVFEMTELAFSSHYCQGEEIGTKMYETLYAESQRACECADAILESLPFSNAWVAGNTARLLPRNSELHLGIQNSLRFWNFFDIDDSINVFCNVGGFGIDGTMSSMIGASLVHPEKLYYCVLGDLAFFYDLNSMGNRHISNNVRIILVNNGRGTEFKLSGNPGSMFGDETDLYIAAAGHYGSKSVDLVRHYAEDLGFKYLSAKSKDEYLEHMKEFVDENNREKSILFEIFTNSEDENDALRAIVRRMATKSELEYGKNKEAIKKAIGQNNINRIKKVLKKD